MTREFRETVQRLLDDNRDNFGRWITEIAADDPGKAVDLLVKLADFAAPRLARTELTGKDGGALVIQAAITDESL